MDRFQIFLQCLFWVDKELCHLLIWLVVSAYNMGCIAHDRVRRPELFFPIQGLDEHLICVGAAPTR